MPTTALTTSLRYTDQATTRVYWIPSIAATNLAPTRAELNAGTDVTGELNGLKGWTVQSSLITTEDMLRPFEAKIPGSTTSPNSELTFYTSSNGVDVRVLMPRGATAFIGFLDGGDVTGNKMEVYPVQVTANGVERDPVGKAASKVTVMFAITKTPAQGISVP